MADLANFVVDQHATYTETVIVYEADGTTLVDLTGYTAALQVRKRYDAEAALLSLTESAGLTLGGAQGTVEITITATQSGALQAGRYVYDLTIEDGSSVVTRVIQGRLTVDAGATR